MKSLFIYQYAFSKVGGIQSFNRTFLLTLENISKKRCIKNDFFGIYDDLKDIKSNLKGRCFNGNKIKALFFLLKNIYYYDIFIISHVNLAVLGIIIKILNPKAKLIFCTHGIEVWKNLPWYTKTIMNKSKVFTVSSFSKKKLLYYNNKLKNIVLFPNAIKIDLKHNIRNPFNKTNGFKLLTVSRLDKSEKDKGIDSTIKALGLIKNKIKFSYYIIGKGNDINRLKHLVSDNNLEDKVHFLGYVNDLSNYYKHSDIFIMPSKKEGFGIVYLEAMLYKKAVIACNYGGVTDVVIDNETGILTNYDNIDEIANAILLLYNDREMSSILGKNGHKRLLNNFSYFHFENRLKKELLSFNI